MNSFQFSIVVASISTSMKMRIDSAFEFGTIMYGAGGCRAGYADERCWQGLYFTLQYPHYYV